METTQNHLFGLQIDDLTSGYLNETAKWGKFLAVLGFVVCALLIVLGLFMTGFMANLPGYEGIEGVGYLSGMLTFIYLLIAVLYFFPCLYLYRFSSAMLIALRAGEAAQLQTSFKNLKSCFRYVGILVIIGIAINVLSLLLMLFGALLS